jgi:replicative superfamily II helicase
MNIKCRKKCSWIKNIKVFILDEAHMINDEKRGTDCESLIMSITLLNPDCRIICLSGTMSNYL